VEKKTPHYKLNDVKSTVRKLGVAAFTKTALDGGRAMGLKSDEIIDTVLSTEHRHFFKSMTTYADHKVWQDVYHVPTTTTNVVAYVKFTCVNDIVVIQFKENNQ
jgi:motility quorum-sensing regulator/GCU-specific mRNA interferase toxin